MVTLTGFVRSFSEKYEAERGAKRVSGVVGLANDIEVRLPSSEERPDPEIAREAVSAIKSQLPYTFEHITPVVKNGWVTLEGEVEWNFQRDLAERAVRRLKGLRGVTNLIHIQPRIAPSEVKRKIEEAFRRSAALEAGDHGRWWMGLGGILSIVAGVLLGIMPLLGAIVLTWWLGIYAMALGLTLLVLAYRLRSQRHTDHLHDATPHAA
ncbi:BON domain-containing protein [Phenylobacterium sp.]|uniref:BON domain-containing protein n=1 Tax=Phenylobacterium sp. TaxID=1871053 RepID=UPI002F411FDC